MKTRAALLEPDVRWTETVGGIDETGAVRLMAICDLYALVEPLELAAAVPHDIVQQFDKARHAFIYSWFAFDLVSLAEQQGYQALELALRERLPPDERRKAEEKRWTLETLINRAVAHHWLARSDFYNPDTKMCLLDLIPMCRNELAHGSTNLFPAGSHVMLGICAKIINSLFALSHLTAAGVGSRAVRCAPGLPPCCDRSL